MENTVAQGEKVKPRKVDDERLRAIIDFEIRNSLGFGGELFEQRRKALDYYYGDKFGNEVEGRSQVVSSDVFDTIEWMMPSLMRIFTSGDDICRFDPEGPEDVKGAEQESNYINHILMKDNDGFKILHDWFKDALMMKNGIVKSWWDESEEVTMDEYEGLNDNEFIQLINTDGVEVLEHTENLSEDMAMQVAMSPGLERAGVTHDVKIKKTRKTGKVQVTVVPPEQHYISRRAEDIDDAMFIGERSLWTISELRETGYDVSESITGDDEGWWQEEYLSRHDYDDSHLLTEVNPGMDGAERKVWVDEAYIKIDKDGDGISEWLKVVKVGEVVLEIEEVDGHPYTAITPTPIPHKFYGLSVADLTMDLQLVKSTLWRSMLDNYYMLNNGRYAVLEGMVNLDDMLTSRPGGVVREKVPNAVRPIDTPPLPNHIYSMIEYVDKVRNERTGIRAFNGLDADTMQNTTATAVSQQVDAANIKEEMIARIFGEGVKRLCLRIHEIVCKHQDQKRVVRLTGEEWVPIDPSHWKHRMDMTVVVGLGNGNKDQKIRKLSMLAQQIGATRQDPELKALTSPKNVYNMLVEGTEAMDMKNHADFFTDPDSQEGQRAIQMARQNQPKDPKVQAEEVKAQAMMQKAQMDAQQELQKMQLEMGKMQAEMKMEEMKQQLEFIKVKTDADNEKASHDIQIEKARAELTAEREQNEVEQAKTVIEIEKIKFEKEKLEQEFALAVQEHVLKVEELELEKEQERNVTIGQP